MRTSNKFLLILHVNVEYYFRGKLEIIDAAEVEVYGQNATVYLRYTPCD